MKIKHCKIQNAWACNKENKVEKETRQANAMESIEEDDEMKVRTRSVRCVIISVVAKSQKRRIVISKSHGRRTATTIPRKKQ